MAFEQVVGHERVKDLLDRALGQGRLSHALLFEGPEGVGKERLALALARRLLCFEGTSCGACAACKQVDASVHPELHVVRRAPDRRGILLDQVHELQDAIALRPLESRGHVAIVADAHDLSFEAQDSLLKTLEEPPLHAHLILVTYRPEALRSTVRSRCQRIRFQRLGRDEIALVARRIELAVPADFPWDLAAGQLTRLRRFLEEDLVAVRGLLVELLSAGAAAAPITFAARWSAWAAAGQDRTAATRMRERDRVRESLMLLLELARDASLLATGREGASVRHGDLAPVLQGCAELADPERLDDLFEAVFEALNALVRNVEASLVLEQLVLSWYAPALR